MTADDPTTTNAALFLLSPRGPFEVRPTPVPTPAAGQVVVRVRAVAVNPVDAITGPLRRLVTPWVRFPTVLGSDVAGEVLAVGPDVTALAVGDRVTAFAAGQEKPRNSAAEGGFQRIVTVLERVTTRLPDDLSFEQAAVLPLALATAAAGLYEADQLALPCRATARTGATRWSSSGARRRASGATPSSSPVPAATRWSRPPVGRTTTSSVPSAPTPSWTTGTTTWTATWSRHCGAVGSRARSLSAVDHSGTPCGSPVVHRARSASRPPTPIRSPRCGRGSPASAASASPPSGAGPRWSPRRSGRLPRLPARGAGRRRFRAAPEAMVVGHGLEALPGALQTLRNGVSARKVVVSMGD